MPPLARRAVSAKRGLLNGSGAAPWGSVEQNGSQMELPLGWAHLPQECVGGAWRPGAQSELPTTAHACRGVLVAQRAGLFAPLQRCARGTSPQYDPIYAEPPTGYGR